MRLEVGIFMTTFSFSVICSVFQFGQPWDFFSETDATGQAVLNASVGAATCMGVLANHAHESFFFSDMTLIL